MYNPDTELLFPQRILPVLRDLRGTPWQELVSSVIAAEPVSLDKLAFVLMMARMNNCATCNSGSYRAMNGCTICTTQSLKRFHDSDQTLIETYQATRGYVEHYFLKKITSYQVDTLNHLH